MFGTLTTLGMCWCRWSGAPPYDFESGWEYVRVQEGGNAEALPGLPGLQAPLITAVLTMG